MAQSTLPLKLYGIQNLRTWVFYSSPFSLHAIFICASSPVYMAPYMLAFTSNSIEIRKADNGSLMQTINSPDVHMFSHKVMVVKH